MVSKAEGSGKGGSGAKTVGFTVIKGIFTKEIF